MKTFHQRFDLGNRRWHDRWVEVELQAQGVALVVEGGEEEVESATSAAQGHELVASLEVVVLLEGIHSFGVLEVIGLQHSSSAWHHTSAVGIAALDMLASQWSGPGEWDETRCSVVVLRVRGQWSSCRRHLLVPLDP